MYIVIYTNISTRFVPFSNGFETRKAEYNYIYSEKRKTSVLRLVQALSNRFQMPCSVLLEQFSIFCSDLSLEKTLVGVKVIEAATLIASMTEKQKQKTSFHLNGDMKSIGT